EATVEATAQGGTFQFKSQGGYDAVGISGGSSPGEIEGDQSITFTFDTPTVITSLSVAFLYPMNDYWGDNWNEVALFTTDLGAFTLEALSDTTSSWSGSGMAQNVSPAFKKEGAVWTITGDDIFGGAITSLVLSSGNPGDDGGYGDFSFHSMVIP